MNRFYPRQFIKFQSCSIRVPICIRFNSFPILVLSSACQWIWNQINANSFKTPNYFIQVSSNSTATQFNNYLRGLFNLTFAYFEVKPRQTKFRIFSESLRNRMRFACWYFCLFEMVQTVWSFCKHIRTRLSQQFSQAKVWGTFESEWDHQLNRSSWMVE